MNRSKVRLVGACAACFVGFGAIGGLMGWALHGHPVLAAVTLALVLVAAVLVWLRWR